MGWTLLSRSFILSACTYTLLNKALISWAPCTSAETLVSFSPFETCADHWTGRSTRSRLGGPPPGSSSSSKVPGVVVDMLRDLSSLSRKLCALTPTPPPTPESQAPFKPRRSILEPRRMFRTAPASSRRRWTEHPRPPPLVIGRRFQSSEDPSRARTFPDLPTNIIISACRGAPHHHPPIDDAAQQPAGACLLCSRPPSGRGLRRLCSPAGLGREAGRPEAGAHGAPCRHVWRGEWDLCACPVPANNRRLWEGRFFLPQGKVTR